MKAKPIGLYVHIPFCLKKCNYCDFCSFADMSEFSRNLYINALIAEINSYSKNEKIAVDTVFFGGGTPSLLTDYEFYRIYEAISESFQILDGAEITLESNPKTLTRQKLSAYTSLGVNRISVGLQTIHENERKILGRVHNFDDFKTAYELVVNAGISNINVDIMYGIPQQTLSSLDKTVSEVLSFEPSHISAYGLILEEGTPLFEAKDTLALPDDETEYAMYKHISRLLKSRGYFHYEISNYAKPGYESRHNLKYWRNQKYIGVGVSAYSYYGDRRYGNTGNIKEYLSPNMKQYITAEQIDKKACMYEYAMLGFRLDEGISLSDYKSLFSVDFMAERTEKIDSYIKGGYMKISEDRIYLTEKGFYVSNAILSELL